MRITKVREGSKTNEFLFIRHPTFGVQVEVVGMEAVSHVRLRTRQARCYEEFA